MYNFWLQKTVVRQRTGKPLGERKYLQSMHLTKAVDLKYTKRITSISPAEEGMASKRSTF